MTSFPTTHLNEAQKLTADAEVDLFTVTLKNLPIVYRFWDSTSNITWQGHTYEAMACSLSGDMRSAEGEEARPLLRVFNPLGIFNEVALNGDLDLAVVSRKRVLRAHLDANTNIFIQRLWYVGRVRELISGQAITLELRSMSEGANFQIPARMYIPSDGYPFVTI